MITCFLLLLKMSVIFAILGDPDKKLLDHGSLTGTTLVCENIVNGNRNSMNVCNRGSESVWVASGVLLVPSGGSALAR